MPSEAPLIEADARTTAIHRIRRLASGPAGAWLRGAFFIGIGGYLVFRLTQIGWADVAQSLPRTPLFYFISIAIFLVLPISEVVNYRLITGGFVPDGFRRFVRKRVLNEGVVTYSGEAYLFGALSALPGFTERRALSAIKDNNVVSAVVSNTWTLVLVAALVASGQSGAVEAIYQAAPAAIAGFGALCVVIYAAIILFFRRITSLSLARLAQVASVHMTKIVLVMGLQVAQWTVGAPGQPWLAWLFLLTVQMVLKRIPFLPNTDLLFLSVALSVAGFAEGGAERLAGMLVASAAMMQIVQLAAFLATSGRGRA